MTIELFFFNVLASLTAAIIVLILSIQVSKSVKWIFTGILARIVDSDLEFVYPNKKSLELDLVKELKRAKFIYILTSKGSELQRDTFAPILNESSKYSTKEIKILLPDVNVTSPHFDWTNKNDKDISNFDNAYGKGFLKEQVTANIKFLSSYIQNGQIELKEYNFPHIARIIITDKFSFYTPYGTSTQSRHSKVYKYRSPGEMYQNHLRLFTELWNSIA